MSSPHRSESRWRRYLERGLLLVGLIGVGAWAFGTLERVVAQQYLAWRFESARAAGDDASPDSADTLHGAGPGAARADAASGEEAEGAADDTLPGDGNRVLPGETSSGATATNEPAAQMTVLGRVEVPRVGVSAMVAEGIASSTLRRAVGHLPDSPLPGSVGNAALAGHRDTFFRALEEVTYGDVVRFVSATGTYEFEVEAVQIVDERNLAVLSPTEDPTITLITCYPFTYVGPAPKRWVVHARLVEDAEATGTADTATSGR